MAWVAFAPTGGESPPPQQLSSTLLTLRPIIPCLAGPGPMNIKYFYLESTKLAP